MICPRRLRLLIEFILIFGLGPLLMWVLGRWKPVLLLGMIPTVWAAAAVCAIILLLDRRFDRRSFLRLGLDEGHWRIVFIRFAILGAALVALVAIVMPQQLFALPRSQPGLWLLLVMAYPWLSVYPQGVIWRAFVTHRYRPLLGRGWPMILIAAAAFAWAHAPFDNTLALGLTFIGGVMFTHTYLRTGSLVMAFIEQSLYGLLVFTIGLDAFLRDGTLATIRALLIAS